MNKRDSSESSNQPALKSGDRFGKKTIGGVAVVVFIAAYSFAQPLLNERMGWDLPALRQDSRGQIVADAGVKNDHAKADPAQGTDVTPTSTTSKPSKSANSATSDTSKPATKAAQQQPAAKSSAKQTKPGASTTKRGPLADRISPSKRDESKSPRGSPQASPKDEDLLYGLLREIGRERYISPAGLQYGPGSAEGHRLEHLRRHVKDIPGRPVHGVFDGEMEGALKTIDQAYEKAKQGIRTSKQVDDGRTIYTVDMGKRIGFTGGQSGARKRNPMVRRVRLVLDGTQVITAYPTN